MKEFLKIEYDQCLSLLKYYDEKHLSIVKYCVALSSGIPAFLVSIFRFGPADIKANIWVLAGMVSSMTFLSLLIMYVVLVQNRLYFVYPARQVNSIRKLCISDSEVNFNNQMYLSTDFSAWKWRSSQTLLILFVAIQLGVFLGFSIFSFNYKKDMVDLIFLSILASLTFTILIFLLTAKYLSLESGADADSSIHR